MGSYVPPWELQKMKVLISLLFSHADFGKPVSSPQTRPLNSRKGKEQSQHCRINREESRPLLWGGGALLEVLEPSRFSR